MANLFSDDYIEDLERVHHEHELQGMIDLFGTWAGQVIYFVQPLAAGSIPIIFHFLYRNNTYFTASYDAVTTYYKYAWFMYWLGKISINGLCWIFEVIAMFGVIPEVNVAIWLAFQASLGTMLFLTVTAFYIVAYDEANTAGDATLSEIIFREMRTLVAAYAFEISLYIAFFPSWFAAMMAVPTLKAMEEEDLESLEADSERGVLNL